LETSSENPIIQAGIAQAEILRISPFPTGNGRVSRLLSYLYLFKYGYDARGLVFFDEYLRSDLVTLRQVLERAFTTGNSTLWLEHFAKGVLVQMQKSLESINNLSFKTTLPASFWKLNDRQKEILNYLEKPDEKITNKKVQSMFKISQITASRDLAKLANLGLLFGHGKGRSRFYTRAT
jgi:Fic family protein